MTNNKTGLTIFILCVIIAIILYTQDLVYPAIGIGVIGVLAYLMWPRKTTNNLVEDVEEEVIEESIDSTVDKELINNLLKDMFKNIKQYHSNEVQSVDELLLLQQNILSNLEKLNEYEPSLLSNIYTEFYEQLNILNTDWIRIKEEYKDLNAQRIMAIINANTGAEEPNTLEEVKDLEEYYNHILDLAVIPPSIKEYCQEKLIGYRAMYEGISAEVKGEPAATFDQLKAPEQVMALSWYADGPLSNFPKGIMEKSIDEEYLQYRVKINDVEPSLISVCDEVLSQDALIDLNVTKSYGEMTPEERGSYLLWLNNMDAADSKSYAKLFVMGLERHLLLQEGPEDVFKMLCQLRNLYAGDKEWENHITKLILICAVINKRKEMIENLFDNISIKVPGILLAASGVTELALSIDYILMLATSVGFSNKRYIKMHPQMFTNNLRQLLYKNYSMEKFPIKPEYFLDEWESIEGLWNPAIEEFSLKIRKIEGSKGFKETLCKLLKENHETVKEILKEQRKTKSNTNVIEE